MTAAAKVKEIKKYLLKTISNSAISSVSITKTVPEIMTDLSVAYGQGYHDPDDQVELVKETIWFNPKRNPLRVFTWLNRQIRIIEAADGEVGDALAVDIVIKGLESEKDVGQFWFRCKGDLKMDKKTTSPILTETLATTVKYVMEYWLAHAPKNIVMAESQLDQAELIASANNIDEG